MDTSLEWAQYVIGLNMEEECQVPTCTANPKTMTNSVVVQYCCA